jgi:hypothetical protein
MNLAATEATRANGKRTLKRVAVDGGRAARAPADAGRRATRSDNGPLFMSPAPQRPGSLEDSAAFAAPVRRVIALTVGVVLSGAGDHRTSPTAKEAP